MKNSIFVDKWTLGMKFIGSFLEEKGYNVNYDSPKSSKVNFLTVMTSDIPKINYRIRELKKVNPNTKVVCGGPHIQGRKDESFDDLNADVVCWGSGCEEIEDLADRLVNNQNLEGIPNVAYKQNGQVVVNASKRTEPIPVSHSLKNFYEHASGIVGVITSLSCGNNCGFCSMTDGYIREEEVVLGELELIKNNNNIPGFQLHDSTIKNSKGIDHFKNLYDKSGTDKLEKISYLDPRILVTNFEDVNEFLKDYCYKGIFFGMDALTEGGAKAIKRRCNGKIRTQKMLDDEKESLNKFIDVFLNENTKITISTIPFYPNVLPEDRNQSLKEIVTFREKMEKKSKNAWILPHILTPFYGTETREEYKKSIQFSKPEDVSKRFEIDPKISEVFYYNSFKCGLSSAFVWKFEDENTQRKLEYLCKKWEPPFDEMFQKKGNRIYDIYDRNKEEDGLKMEKDRFWDVMDTFLKN